MKTGVTTIIPSAAAMCREYAALKMPVAIIAGAQDRLIDPAAQSHRLHQAIARSSLHIVPGCGHMVHQTSPDAVMAAIETVIA